MMAVSSPLFSNFGVCLADPKNKKLNTIEAPLSTGIPVHYSSSQPSIVHSEFKNFEEINGDNDHLDGTVKKLNHNASERDRRKKFNSLCSSLRSLLPATDHTKKISFPVTVARVIKYIPDLKKEVGGLTQKKEDLTLRSIPKKEYSADFNNKQTIIKGGIQSSLSVISANQVGNREVIIHISILKTNKSSFAEAVSELEEEGLLLLNASSFETLGDRVFYNLHFQAGHYISRHPSRREAKWMRPFT
ncbi:transcription factor bHLH100-like isoform X2 [Nicotiana tabacum]|uniref:Transcription factor bHLH100-like isoform X2 n=2 Tax=Nicotiana TaxID=4085 RepID=A0A1S3ZN20_TOBAC|nr:PREDICTED: transcription factor bHLH100-like isoform X2 [Nicotiana sylvestris]XP_016465935.1 PREDICTED: transcription factor bHLH100-like isoform X2 [Nicotiana tabacum]